SHTSAALPIMISMRFGHGVTWDEILAGGLRGGVAIAIACTIWWIARRVPWPRPFRVRFVLTHVAAWLVLAFTWCIATNVSIAIAGVATFDALRFVNDYFFLGAFIYAFVAGPTYVAAES